MIRLVLCISIALVAWLPQWTLAQDVDRYQLTAGPGLVTYMGALDNNPGDGVLQFIVQAQPSVMANVDRRLGGALTASADLSYDFLKGERFFNEVGDTEPRGFANHAVALNLSIGYDLGWSVRPYVGVGPMLLVNPTYRGFHQIPEEERQELGTRVVGSVAAGVVLFDQMRIGVRWPLTNYVDGWRGGTGDLIIEHLVFLNLGVPLHSWE